MTSTTAATGTRLPARLVEHDTTLVAAGVAFSVFLSFIQALITSSDVPFRWRAEGTYNVGGVAGQHGRRHQRG